MGIKTTIEYCDSSTNPTSGCNGCELWIPGKGGDCYAGGMHTRFSGSAAYPGPFEQIDLQPGRMAKAAAWPDLTGTERPDKPWLNGLPRVIFIGDMADNFSRGVPFDYLVEEVIEHVDSVAGGRHLWMWFTKQPRRMAAFSKVLNDYGIDWPDHLMAVTSITSAKTVKRLRWLCEVDCRRKGISFEPLLGPVGVEDIRRAVSGSKDGDPDAVDFKLRCEIDWAAFGGLSGSGRAPMPSAWPLTLINYFEGTLDVPCFFKQWGAFVEFEQAPDDVAQQIDAAGYMPSDGPFRVGKKRAGRLLDGRTWDGMPEAWRVESSESRVESKRSATAV